MKLQKLIGQCTDALNESAYESYEPDNEPKSFGATINTNDGYIDLWMTREKYGHYSCEALISHDDEAKNVPERYLKNFETFLSEQLADCIDWDALEEKFQYDTMDEWQAHGFRDEADFWHWKEGR